MGRTKDHDDHDEKPHGGHVKAGGHSHAVDDEAGDDRRDDGVGVPGCTVEGDGAVEGVGVHEGGIKGLMGGSLDGPREALDEGVKEDVPRFDEIDGDQSRQQQGHSRVEGVGNAKEKATVHSIGDDASDYGEEDGWHGSGQAGVTEVESRSGEVVDEPAHGYDAHLGTAHRCQGTDPEPSVGGIVEGGRYFYASDVCRLGHEGHYSKKEDRIGLPATKPSEGGRFESPRSPTQRFTSTFIPTVTPPPAH